MKRIYELVQSTGAFVNGSSLFLMYSYKGGLLGCLSDINICLYSFCCLPCQNGMNLAKTRKEECNIFHVLMVTHPYWIRKSVLQNEGVTGDNLMDCLVTSICAPCVVSQDARALL